MGTAASKIKLNRIELNVHICRSYIIQVMLWLLCRYTKCNCLIEKLEGSEVKEGEKVSDFKLTYTCGDQEVSVFEFSFGDPL